MVVSLDHHMKDLKNEMSLQENRIKRYQETLARLRIGYYKELILQDSYAYKLEAEIQGLKSMAAAELGEGPVIRNGPKVLLNAKLSEDDKNKISHRALALNKVTTFLQTSKNIF